MALTIPANFRTMGVLFGLSTLVRAAMILRLNGLELLQNANNLWARSAGRRWFGVVTSAHNSSPSGAHEDQRGIEETDHTTYHLRIHGLIDLAPGKTRVRPIFDFELGDLQWRWRRVIGPGSWSSWAGATHTTRTVWNPATTVLSHAGERFEVQVELQAQDASNAITVFAAEWYEEDMATTDL